MFATFKKVSVRALVPCASALALALPVPVALAQKTFEYKTSTAVTPVNALVPICSGPTAGSGDGMPGTPKVPDGKTVQRLAPAGMTAVDRPDLAISWVKPSLSGNQYSLSFCVLNRGKKAAFSPITVAVVAGDLTLQELTIFRSMPGLTYSCFGPPDQLEVPPGANLSNATIEVVAATGETAMGNNKCRIDWPKR